MTSSQPRKFEPVLFIGLALFACLWSLSLLISGSFWLELIVSFLPYWVVLSTLVLVGLGLFVFWQRRIAWLYWLCLGLLLLPTAFSAIRLLSFWQPQIALSASTPSSTKLFFQNVYVFNEHLDQLNQTFQTQDADILALAEWSDEMTKSLPSLEAYPYIATTTNPIFPFEGALFSRYPLEDVERDGRLDALAATIQTPNRTVRVVVTHPTAPVTRELIKQREMDLDRLADFLNSQKVRYPNMIVVGDFNLTPWSPSFATFYAKLNNLTWLNAGHDSSFTWCEDRLPIACATIDQSFVSSDIGIQSFHVNKTPTGSDHRGLSITF